MDNKKKFVPNNMNKDIVEIKELLAKMCKNIEAMKDNLEIMKDILDTRKRIHPTSEEIFGK